MRKDLHEQNRRSWNHATAAHNSHKGDQAAFLRAGGSTLFPEELELLGDLAGRTLVHLQCNAGQDTLSLAARGAAVTGVDISDEAIEFGRTLSADSGIAGGFERADVYDWLADAAAAGRRFDVVYTGYGAVCWMSDLRAWARGIAGVLAPGGRLVVMEFHPALYLIDDEDGRLVWARQAKGGGGGEWAWPTGVNDYVALSGAGLVPSGYEAGVEGFANPEGCHEFEWNLAEIVDAVAGAGLVIETVREWRHCNGWRGFPWMVDLGERRFGLPEGAPPLPLMCGIVARR